jgi:hypothetical protein
MNRNYRNAAATLAVCGLGMVGLGVLSAQTQPTRPKDTQPSQRQPTQQEQRQKDQRQQDQREKDQREKDQREKDRLQPNQRPGEDQQQPGDEAQRYSGPFMFQSPQTQTAMNQRAQQLIRMEQQFETRRTELLRRLGEARTMTGERKLDALADVLQQVLLEQEQVNQYLIAMRTAWTGDMSLFLSLISTIAASVVSRGRRCCGVLQGDALDLGGDDDAHLDQVAVLVGQGVVAEVGVVGLLDLVGDDRAVEPAVGGDLLDGARGRGGRCRRRPSRRRRAFLRSLSRALRARMTETPPPGRMPSSTAARQACRASSTRAFFSFISTRWPRRR